MMKDIIRKCIFRPYRKDQGPVFTLQVWEDRQEFNTFGLRQYLGYKLHMSDNGKSTLLFEGADFGCSPMHCTDSDGAIATLMSFLTLRIGDTDSEYFDNYTNTQLDYRDNHAEYLNIAVIDRFGEVA